MGRGAAQYPRAPRFERFGSAPSIVVKDYRSSGVGTSRQYAASEVVQKRPKSYEDVGHMRSHRREYLPSVYRTDAYRDNDDDLARRMIAHGGIRGHEARDTSTALRKERMSRPARRHDNTNVFDSHNRRQSNSRDDTDSDDDVVDHRGRAVSEFLPSVPQAPQDPPTSPQWRSKTQAKSQSGQRYQRQEPCHTQSLYIESHGPRYGPMQRKQYPRQPLPPSRYTDSSSDEDGPTAPANLRSHGTSRTRTVAKNSTDFTVGRLADRFNPEHRASPLHRSTAPLPPDLGGGMVGMPTGPLSHGSLPRISPHSTVPMPTIQPPMIGDRSVMPIVPRRQEVPITQSYRMGADYTSLQPLLPVRPPERPIMVNVCGEGAYYEESSSDNFGSGGRHSRRRQRHRSRSRHDASSTRRASQVPQSELAGLTGLGSGMDRVREWREFVGDNSRSAELASDIE
ncbi:MAG: hypothetical protein SEPTF4163_003264 [Sporothrix epigloea]